MHPLDVEQTLKTMRILIDSREQPTEKSKLRYAQFGVPHYRQKLDFGDYSATFFLPDGTEYSLADKCCVERKMDFGELCSCYTHERERFEREFGRAKKAGARTYLLVENSSWELAYAGNYRSQMKPQALIASMMAWMARYDCHIVMCKSETSGKIIKDILYREAKERLTNLGEEADDG